MKIFISGEIQSEVGEVYRIVMLKLEHAFNAHFSVRTFGAGLVKLTYIAIIWRIDSPTFDGEKNTEKRNIRRSSG